MVIFNSYVKLPEGIGILQGNIRILIGNYSHFLSNMIGNLKGIILILEENTLMNWLWNIMK